VNDFIDGIDTLGSNPTARLLPPEFLLLGITKENWIPWTPQDSLICGILMSFNLSWNWSNDLLREALR
jgi:acyl-homoserine lactone acylase PvdQ